MRQEWMVYKVLPLSLRHPIFPFIVDFKCKSCVLVDYILYSERKSIGSM
jgi:hypothetical protein